MKRQALVFKQANTHVMLSFFQLSLALCLMTVASQIQMPLPFSPVPLTFGPQGALLVGALFSPLTATMAAITYFLTGAMGAPIFAGFYSGLGMTAGYIFGYIFAASIVSNLLSSNKLKKSWWSQYLIIASGMLPIYFFGVAYLTFCLGGNLSLALDLGLYPYILSCLLIKVPVIVSFSRLVRTELKK